MEFFAILKVAEALNIPVGGVFIITNYCNSNAHRDFMANREEAMSRLTEYMSDRV
jgi:nucleoside phosphorylase